MLKHNQKNYASIKLRLRLIQLRHKVVQGAFIFHRETKYVSFKATKLSSPESGRIHFWDTHISRC